MQRYSSSERPHGTTLSSVNAITALSNLPVCGCCTEPHSKSMRHQRIRSPQTTTQLAPETSRQMDSIALIRRLHQHRLWVNGELLDTADQLTEEQLRQPFEIGQGSIWKSLAHLYAAEYVWLDALVGNENPLTPGDARGKLPGNQEGEAAMTALSELRSRWSELDQRWTAYLIALSSDSLTETVYKNNSVSGQRLPTQRSDILIHVCTHAQYTTAQVVNMMRHVGVEQLPDPMLITLARQEQKA